MLADSAYGIGVMWVERILFTKEFIQISRTVFPGLYKKAFISNKAEW